MLGFDVALSGDRKTMAVGAYAADPNGYVRLYGNNGTDWNIFSSLTALNLNQCGDLVIHLICPTTDRS